MINAAGLQALPLAQRLDRQQEWPRPHYARGHYYALSGRSPFSRLIYPLPEPGGLGIHVTLDMAGRARFGPDVQWLARPDYRFDESRKPAFVEAIRRYYPALDEASLQPAYTGIRAKLAGPGAGFQDFMIAPAANGRMLHLLGFESPGLTAALALAERVEQLLQG